MRFRALGAWWVVAALGCATGRAPSASVGGSTPAQPAEGRDVVVQVPLTQAETGAQPALKYVDLEHGFQIERPATSGWDFKSGEDLSTESIAIPLVVLSDSQKAQVVVQIAPAVATPLQFAERLTAGLETRAGFRTSDIVPLPLAEGAVGFDFGVEDEVGGRVAIFEASEGRVFVLLATWPAGAPDSVKREVEQILASMKATPAR